MLNDKHKRLRNHPRSRSQMPKKLQLVSQSLGLRQRVCWSRHRLRCSQRQAPRLHHRP
jgi:hypothetical protein